MALVALNESRPPMRMGLISHFDDGAGNEMVPTPPLPLHLPPPPASLHSLTTPFPGLSALKCHECHMWLFCVQRVCAYMYVCTHAGISWELQRHCQ